MRLRLSAAVAGAAMLVFVLVPMASAAVPTAAQRDAVRALVNAAGAGTRVTWDHGFGTPRSILNAKGYLSGPSAGAPAVVARAWIDGNRAAFGLTAADVQALAVTRDHALPGTGTHVVDFQQVVSGVQAVASGRLIVAVTKDGRVLSYAGNPARSQRSCSRAPTCRSR
jgi:extracellular elastinolytic metalloproteinase